MSGKNRKFGRNSKRSHSMSRYRAENREQVNRRERMERHKRHHPKDKTVMGAVPVFPPVVISKGEEPKLSNHTIHGYLQKDGSIIVPNTMYRVVALGNITLEFTHLYSVAEKAFHDCRTVCTLYEEEQGIRKVPLKTKRALPVMSDKALAIAAYGNQHTRSK